jgi:hypothetical protein
VAITESKCGEVHTEFDFSNPEDKKTFEDCTQWLGPNLPGITAPDFTGSVEGSGSEQPALHPGERRSAGQPDAGPLPGQPDISKPQITLPPDLQKAIDELAPKDPQDLPRRLRRRLEEILGPTPAPVPAPVPTPRLDTPVPAPAPVPGGGPALLDFLLAP